jgi:hypothetical protein
MFVVSEYVCRDRSQVYELDRSHYVRLRFLSSSFEEASSFARRLAAQHHMEEEEPQGSAVLRFSGSSQSPSHSHRHVAVLDVPEGESMSVLACPAIHDIYVE